MRWVVLLGCIVALLGCRGGAGSIACSEQDRTRIQALAQADMDTLTAVSQQMPTMTETELGQQRVQIEAIYRDINSNPWPDCAKAPRTHLLQAIAALHAAITKAVDDHDQVGAQAAMNTADDELRQAVDGLQAIKKK